MKYSGEKYLAALNDAGDILQKTNTIIPFQKFLDVIGPVTSAGRIYIFLNHTGINGDKLTSQMAEWCSDGVESEIDTSELHNLSYDTSFPHWHEKLSTGNIISCEIDNFPAEEKEILATRGIRSILMAPLLSGGEFIGFIGFDNCSSDDEWSGLEIEFIKAAAHNLSYRIEENWVLSRLKTDNNLFSAVMDAMDVIIYAVDLDTYEIVYMNKFAIDKFGEGVGRKCWKFFFEDQSNPCSFCVHDKLIEDDGSFKEPYLWEHYFEKIDQWCMCSTRALKWPDGRLVSFQISTNITQHKVTECKLHKLIEEKDSLLSEVHHRVKNNLQSLIYLISMQADSVDNPNAVEILKELQERIKAMSLVHTQLYQSKNLSSINFEKYVSELVNSLIRAIAVENINTYIQVSDINLDIKTAIPCGLIINELVTNIIKHAFKTGKNKKSSLEMNISMVKNEDMYVLKVGDNGAGFTMHPDYMKQTNLGLKLVTIWATHQLGGTLDINEESGVEFIITFSEKR